jgi:Ca2+:H+ antiporter
LREEHGETGEHWPIGLAVGTLLVVTVLVALVSEIFVESVQKAAQSFGISPAFVGFIIVSIVGAAAEMAVAFRRAQEPPGHERFHRARLRVTACCSFSMPSLP